MPFHRYPRSKCCSKECIREVLSCPRCRKFSFWSSCFQWQLLQLKCTWISLRNFELVWDGLDFEIWIRYNSFIWILAVRKRRIVCLNKQRIKILNLRCAHVGYLHFRARVDACGTFVNQSSVKFLARKCCKIVHLQIEPTFHLSRLFLLEFFLNVVPL